MSDWKYCTCDLWCAVVDPQSGVHRSGALVSRSTYQNHRADQAVKDASNARTVIPEASHEEPTPCRPNKYRLLLDEIKTRADNMSFPPSLFFVNPPTSGRPYEYQSISEGIVPAPNDGPFALRYEEQENLMFMEHEARLLDILRSLQGEPSEEGEMLESVIKEELYRLWQFKEQEWTRQQNAVSARESTGHVIFQTGKLASTHEHRCGFNL